MVLSRLGFKVRVVIIALSVASLAGVVTAGLSRHASASEGRVYLSLGDSVAFGFITQAGFQYVNAHNFVGFPDYTAEEVGFTLTNAACPGEATGGFLSSTGADNGCRAFRSFASLHVAYTGTQMSFAESFLRAHRNTRLVTIELGANNLFLLQNACLGVTSCVLAGLPAALATIDADMNTILGNLRATGYHGVLEVVNYYSLDYTDTTNTAITRLLNGAETASAAAHNAVVADVFSAFANAAAAAGGKTCHAGLLNVEPGNQSACDVHPTQSGHQLMAQAVDRAFVAAGEGEND